MLPCVVGLRFHLAIPLLLASTGLWADEQLKETSCFFMLGSGDGQADPIRMPDLHVLHPPTDQPRFVVELENGAVLESVVCRRSRPEFALGDRRILDAGFPFYVVSGDRDKGSEVVLTLERTEVGHRVRHIDGRNLTTDEEASLIGLIEALDREESNSDSDGAASDS